MNLSITNRHSLAVDPPLPDNNAMENVVYVPGLLEERVRLAQNKPKRTRTRLMLLAATAVELEQSGYEALTINNIVARAGLARGTFYLYFPNRAEAAIAVRRSFMALLRKTRPRGGAKLNAWQAIHRMNQFYVSFYARNARLLAGTGALFHERPDLLKNRDQVNHRWAGILLRDMVRREGLNRLTPEEEKRRLLSLRLVIIMADEALRNAFIDPPPYLSQVITSHEDLAEVLTMLWYRCLYGKDPDPADKIAQRNT